MPGYGNNPGGWGPGGYQDYVEQYIGPSTCTIFQTGSTPGTSHIVPNSGTVTVARIKSGENPAPVSIATVRQYTGKRPSDQQLVTTCCRGISETPTVNLKPNAITEIPVNLLVESKPYDPNNPGVAGYRDWVVVNVHGTTGTLPIYDAGLPRPIIAPAGDPGAVWMFPQLDPNQDNLSAWVASRFEVLMNYDWVPTASPPTNPTNPTNPTDPTACVSSAQLAACAPASVRNSKVKLTRGKVRVSVACATTSGQRCKGKLRLRLAAKKPTLLASSPLSIAAGKSKKIAVSLDSKDRRLLKGKKRIRVDIVISGQPLITKQVKLTR